MKGFIFHLIFTVTLVAIWWPSSSHAQVVDDGVESMLLMMKNAINMLSDQKATLSFLGNQYKMLSDDLKSLDSKVEAMDTKLKALDQKVEAREQNLQSGLREMTETLINSSLIDECSEGSHRCSKFAQCIDNIFSYKCRCHDGYIGDGFQCDEICEDSLKTVRIKGLGCLQLQTTQRTWEDARLNCQAQGMRLAENISREHFGVLWKAFGDLRPSYGGLYLWMWVGGKDRNWQSSGEQIGSGAYQSGDPNGPSDYCIYLEMDGDGDSGDGLADAPCSNAHCSLCQLLPTP